jgi:hypothetical protein
MAEMLVWELRPRLFRKSREQIDPLGSDSARSAVAYPAA